MEVQFHNQRKEIVLHLDQTKIACYQCVFHSLVLLRFLHVKSICLIESVCDLVFANTWHFCL